MDFGKSFRTNKDIEIIKFDQNYCNINLEFEKEKRTKKIELELSDKKTIKINDIKCKRISELVGNLNIVIFRPDDLELLKQGPNLRRKFLDMFISGLKPKYLFLLNQYTKILENRNSLLKEIKNYNKNIEMLEIWNQKLVEFGYEIYKYRKEYIEKLNQKIYDIHRKITNEEIKIEYISCVNEKEQYFNILEKYKNIDIIRGITSKGIHRDDLIFYINGKQINLYGSQGQCRSSILSLKFSELEVIYDELGEYPILLLDDVLSELDEKRKEKLIKNINKYQVLITSTEKENFMNDLNNENIQYFKVENRTSRKNGIKKEVKKHMKKVVIFSIIFFIICLGINIISKIYSNKFITFKYEIEEINYQNEEKTEKKYDKKIKIKSNDKIEIKNINIKLLEKNKENYIIEINGNILETSQIQECKIDNQKYKLNYNEKYSITNGEDYIIFKAK